MTAATSSQQYALVTLSYWGFTLTDGALRMLILLFFHGLGFTPIEIASLFILYELSGVITSLFGGWIAARIGLIPTLQIGLFLQIVALAMMLLDSDQLTVVYVMCAQALSGVGKDLNKLSAKSSIKLLVPSNANTLLFKWVAILTGFKNAVKGFGFFLGGALLSWIGFISTILVMLALLSVIFLGGFLVLTNLAIKNTKPAFRDLFSKSSAINYLSAARLFLFGSRDIWFVIALPVYLQSELTWSYWQVGSLMAAWVIGYGGIQMLAPKITRFFGLGTDNPKLLVYWGATLCVIPSLLAGSLAFSSNEGIIIICALVPFAFVFAVNSSVHSYFILALSQRDNVSLDVGFYYMANAGGRLFGTLLSGVIFQLYGLQACLLLSSLMIVLSTLWATRLPSQQNHNPIG